MELNVNTLIDQFDKYIDPADLSGSIAEHGNGAGQYTWSNCLELAKDALSDSDEDLHLLALDIIENEDEVQYHFAQYGAWSRDEIESWSSASLVAIAIQEIAAAYRELEALDFDTESDQFSGRLYQCDIEDHENFGDWYFYLGV